MSLISQRPNDLLESFLEDYNKLYKIDFDKSRQLLKDKTLYDLLTKEWYRYLEKNNLKEALTVYDNEYYFLDLFECYKSYSRKYLKSLEKPPLYDLVKNIKSFVDIGCGLGYSTGVLKQMFPKAKGYATNLKGTRQWKFNEVLAKRLNFTLVESVDNLGHIDLVFASEYFEHIESPIGHLANIIDKISPKYFIIANSFNTKSIGHFHDYNGINESKISRVFNNFLVEKKYGRVKAKLWNNRPAIWKLNNGKS
jgi:SAM-dependent methyltransferase